MRNLATFLGLSALALGQQTSPTGFGRMIYPGTGGPTGPARTGFVGPGIAGAGFGRVVYPGTGAPAALRPGVTPAFVAAPPPRPAHLPHARSAVIPFPVFYGGGYGYYAAFEPPPVARPFTEVDYAPRPPVVIINQNFQPDTPNPVLRDYSNTPLPPAVASRPAPPAAPQAARDPRDDDPTIYLVALSDGTVFQAVAYWVQGDTLNYITVEGSHNRATLDLVDRERSLRLNQERKVEFKLPKR
jgi:hypothetical protein